MYIFHDSFCYFADADSYKDLNILAPKYVLEFEVILKLSISPGALSVCVLAVFLSADKHR